MTPLLSIVVAGVPDRLDVLTELLDEFRRQIGDSKEVELLVLLDDRRRALGLKRDILNEHAVGEYIVHWDDDDWPSEVYIMTVLAAIAQNPGVDVVSYPAIRIDAPGHEMVRVDYHVDKEFPLRYSIKNPIRADLAKSVLYGEYDYESDMVYQQALNDSILTQATINRPLYFYMPNYMKTITNRELSRVKEIDRSFA